jgi:uncharacterized membrane protein
VAYVVSFLIIGIMWAQHHGLLTAALLLYGGTLTGIALLYNGVWHYIRLRGLLRPDLDLAVTTSVTRGYIAGPFLYAAAMLLAPLQAAASYVVWVVLALFFLRGVPVPRQRAAP